jgi:hypothetical protein
VKQAKEDLQLLREERAAKSDELSLSEADQEVELVKQINEIDEATQAKVSFIVGYLKTDKVPKVYDPKDESKKSPEADESRLVKDIKNAQSKASKLRAYLNKNPENQEKQTDLAKLEKEIELLQDQKKLLSGN